MFRNMCLVFLLVINLLSCQSTKAEPTAEALPGLPEYLARPFAEVDQRIVMEDAHHLHSYFEETAYDLDKVRNEKVVPQIFVKNLPPDLNKLPVPHKTSLFIRLLLSSVVDVNNQILAVRSELQLLADKKAKGVVFTAEEQRWLEQVAADHDGHHTEIDVLLDRVDIIPVGLIMAQAIDESGWGTSHFAIAGNALYGQHLASNSNSKFLTTPGGKVKVAAFDNLYHSTASYIHNLNRTSAYDKLRTIRSDLRKKHGHLTGHHLAEALLHYSERGQHYVDELRWLIKHYRLDELNTVQLAQVDNSTLLSFNR